MNRILRLTLCMCVLSVSGKGTLVNTATAANLTKAIRTVFVKRISCIVGFCMMAWEIFNTSVTFNMILIRNQSDPCD